MQRLLLQNVVDLNVICQGRGVEATLPAPLNPLTQRQTWLGGAQKMIVLQLDKKSKGEASGDGAPLGPVP